MSHKLKKWSLRTESETVIDTCIYSSRFSIVYRYLGEDAPTPEKEHIKREINEEIGKVVARGCPSPIDSIESWDFYTSGGGWDVEVTGTMSTPSDMEPTSALYQLATSRALGETLQTLFHPVEYGCLHLS